MRKVLCYLIPVLVIIVIIVSGAYMFYATEETKTITVKEKWVKYHDDDAKYLCSDTDGNVYEMTDELLLWKFDASDRYAKVEENRTYEITTYGWRVHWLSWYPNIVEIKEVG